MSNDTAIKHASLITVLVTLLLLALIISVEISISMINIS